MTRYRIVNDDGAIYVETRNILSLFRWYKVHQELGWGCSAPQQFGSVEHAEDYIKEELRSKDFEVIKHY